MTQELQRQIDDFMAQLDAQDPPDTDWAFDETLPLDPDDFDEEAPTIPYVRRPMSEIAADGPDGWRSLLMNA